MEEGLHKLKGEFGQFLDLRGKREPGKKEGIVFPHLGRQGACHDNIKSEDPQTKKIFRQ